MLYIFSILDALTIFGPFCSDMERFNFANSEFKSDAPETFRQLWKEKNLTNVTLVSSDEVSTLVHKVILATASPLLKRVLMRNAHEHPLILFNSIRSRVLEQLVEFIYLGECSVDQADLDSFLDAGKSLQIRGLTNNEAGSNSGGESGAPVVQVEEVGQVEFPKEQIGQVVVDSVDQVGKVEWEKGLRGSALTDGNLLFDNPLLDPKHNIDVKKEVGELPKIKDEIYPIFKIERIGDEEVLRIKSSDKLYRDLFKNKEGKFQCNQCDYSQVVKRFGEMVNHIKAVHEGLKLSCELCQFQTGYKRCLTEHVKIIHEGKLKECKECSFTTKNRSSLSIHMTKHKLKENMWTAKKTRRQCSKCEYDSESVKEMKKHILENHL